MFTLFTNFVFSRTLSNTENVSHSMKRIIVLYIWVSVFYMYEAYNLKIISQYDICLKGTTGDCNF